MLNYFLNLQVGQEIFTDELQMEIQDLKTSWRHHRISDWRHHSFAQGSFNSNVQLYWGRKKFTLKLLTASCVNNRDTVLETDGDFSIFKYKISEIWKSPSKFFALWYNHRQMTKYSLCSFHFGWTDPLMLVPNKPWVCRRTYLIWKSHKLTLNYCKQHSFNQNRDTVITLSHRSFQYLFKTENKTPDDVELDFIFSLVRSGH